MHFCNIVREIDCNTCLFDLLNYLNTSLIFWIGEYDNLMGEIQMFMSWYVDFFCRFCLYRFILKTITFTPWLLWKCCPNPHAMKDRGTFLFIRRNDKKKRGKRLRWKNKDSLSISHSLERPLMKEVNNKIMLIDFASHCFLCMKMMIEESASYSRA